MGKDLFENDNKPPVQRAGRDLFADKSQEPEGFVQKLPRNVVAGLAEGGHQLLNTPSDFAQFIEQQGQKFGNRINKAFSLEKYGIKQPEEKFSFSKAIPRQQDYNFAEMLGQRGEPTFSDKAIQKGSQYLPELLMAKNVLKDVVPHLTKWGASKTLKKATQLGRERRMGPLSINNETIEDLRQYLPNTAPYRNALEDAHYGDYNKLFSLQSDVGKHASQQARSFFSAAERAHGREGLAARHRLLDEIHANLKSQGHHDISNLLRQGQNEYRRYMAFKPYRNALGMAAGAYAIPKNALTNLVKKLLLHKG